MDTTFDRTKMPPDLWARRVWAPDATARDRRSIVLVTDRRRLLIGGLIMAFGLVVVIVVRVAHAHWAIALSALILEVIGGLYLTGGQRSGFYEVAADGSLAKYLGKTKPDLRSMRVAKIK
jgi:hypothetical protein